uniref:OSK domain-containing protein n=1 Tax=Cyclopterus lumpus TaxID=8103 RepID=A0A8C2ZPZ6_CYCLU
MKKQKGRVQVGDDPPWNGRPKRLEQGGRITDRAEHHEMTDLDGWPALSLRHGASSTPAPRRPQQWITARERGNNNKLPQQTSVQVSNRFTPLMQVPGFPSDDQDSIAPSHNKVRPESQEPQKELTTGLTKLTTGPKNLIVGDFSVRDMKSMFSVDTKVLCYPNDMVSDLEEKILEIAAAHTTVKNIILHIGSNDVVKQESEMLKQDFKNLLNTVSSLNAEVFISGPLPPIRRGPERFTRLLALNTWLSTACPDHSVHFIDNFNIFWNRKQLFKTDGLCLNKAGVKLFTSNNPPPQITIL